MRNIVPVQGCRVSMCVKKCLFIACESCLLLHACRGNLAKRLSTLESQMIEEKVIKLDKVFVRAKKRVLNKLCYKN